MTNIIGLFYRYNLHRCITIQVKSYLAMLPIFTILIFSYKKLIISLFIYQILILIIPYKDNLLGSKFNPIIDVYNNNKYT